MKRIFVALSTQSALFTAQKVVFLFSSVLNFIALVCLLKRTPPHQAVIRKYLIFLQVTIIMCDVTLDAMAEPMPLFPLAGFYCCGWLCRSGLPPTLLAVFLSILMWNIVFGIALCLNYRHQSILFQSSKWKFSDCTLRIFLLIFLAIFYCPALVYAIQPIDHSTVERVIDDNDLDWVRGRGLYHFEPKGIVTTAIGLTIATVATVSNLSAVLIFAHMHFVLHQDSSNRSSASTKAIKRSLIVLFTQLFVPSCMIGGSVTVIGIGLATHDLIPFELSLTMFYVICAHSIAHNLILLSMTREYRKFIADIVRCKKTSEIGSNNSGQIVRPLNAPRL